MSPIHPFPAVGEPDPGLVVIDTDLGHDPDDAVALALAARLVARLVVVTADESGGRRARFARRLLDALGRADVPVIAGTASGTGGEQRFLLDAYISAIPAQPDGLVETLARLTGEAVGPIVWVGQGPMTNLATVLTVVPELADRIHLFQMGGWLNNYRHPWASNNFHIDPSAAGTVLRMIECPHLVLAEHTAHHDIRITATSALYRSLAGPPRPGWQELLGACFRAWFAHKPGSWMHDPLTLSAALGCEFVEFASERLRLDSRALLHREYAGREYAVSTTVDYLAFDTWLHDVLWPTSR